MSSTRRSFISKVSAVSAGALLAKGAPAHAANEIKAGNPGKLLRIGVLTCHPTHHHMPNIYGPIIQCIPQGNYTATRMTGMILTHIWDHDPKRVESFCERFGTKPVKRFRDMVGEVDGIMLTDLRAADYFPTLSEPYLKAGIPIFYNRCFTPRVSKAKEIAALSKKHGTPIIVASGWEYTKEAYTLNAKVKELGPNIRGVTGYNASTEVTHDVHGLWLLMAAVGGGIESVAVHRSVKSIYENGSDTWTIKFKPRENNKAFYATMHNTVGFGSNASIRVNFQNIAFEQSLWGGGDRGTRLQYFFVPPLLAFQRIVEGRGMEQSLDHIVEKTAAFIAGFKSHLELGGQTALLSELDDDYYVSSDPNPMKLPDAVFD